MIVGLVQLPDVAAIRLAQGVHVLAIAVHPRDLSFEAVDGGLVVAALQVVAALLQRRLHGELHAQPAFAVLAEGWSARQRKSQQQSDAHAHTESVPDHDSILARGLESIGA